MHSLAPGFGRMTYTGVTAVHHAMFPLRFAATPVSGIEPTLLRRDGSDVAAITGWGDLLDAYRSNFDDGVTFGLVEIYKVDLETNERTFIYGWDAATNGLSSLGSVNLGMATMTFKTREGNRLNITMMESIHAVNQKLYPPFEVDSPQAELAAYMVSAGCIVFGRDNNDVFAPISLTSKTSDALRKHAGL